MSPYSDYPKIETPFKVISPERKSKPETSPVQDFNHDFKGIGITFKIEKSSEKMKGKTDKKPKKHHHDKSSHHSSIDRKHHKSSSHHKDKSSTIIGKRERTEQAINNTLISIEIPKEKSHDKRHKSAKIAENPEEPIRKYIKNDKVIIETLTQAQKDQRLADSSLIDDNALKKLENDLLLNK